VDIVKITPAVNCMARAGLLCPAIAKNQGALAPVAPPFSYAHVISNCTSHFVLLHLPCHGHRNGGAKGV